MSLRQYALLGSPVAGSKSPLIHHTSFVFNDIEASYEAFEVSPEQLGEALKAFIRQGYSGFNITIPHKEAVLAYLDDLDPLAERMGAVNTLVLSDGKLLGYNTDGPGLMQALSHHGVCLEGLKTLVLGAGGAAKGICHALALAGGEKIDIYNRTVEKASELARQLRTQYGLSSEAVTIDNLGTYDLVINATSLGMNPHPESLPIEPELFPATTVFCDIVYKPHETLLLKRARAMGARCIYGIEMLIYQALLSEQLWEGKEIDLDATKHELLETEGLFR